MKKIFYYVEFFILILYIFVLPDANCKKASVSRSKPSVKANTNTGTRNGGINPNLSNNRNLGSNPGGGFGSIGSSGRSSYKGLSSGQKMAATGLLGAAAGAYVGYKLGRATSSFHHGGHQYWYGSRYYQATPNMRKCVFEVDETAPNWNVRDEDNSVIREIVFECNSYETCCATSCCRTPTNVRVRHVWTWWQTLLVIMALGLLFAACAFCLIKQIKKRRQAQSDFAGGLNNDESQKPFGTGYSDANQPSYYPSQPYPSAGPTYTSNYPPAHGYNYPPAPGYNYPPQNNMYPPPTYQPVPSY